MIGQCTSVVNPGIEPREDQRGEAIGQWALETSHDATALPIRLSKAYIRH